MNTTKEKTASISIHKVEHKAIDKNDYSKLVITGDYAKAVTNHKSLIPYESRWRKISKCKAVQFYCKKNNIEGWTYYRHYYPLMGFIEFDRIEFKGVKAKEQNADRTADMRTLKKSVAKLKAMINCNVTRKTKKFTRFFTVTYKQNFNNWFEFMQEYPNKKGFEMQYREAEWHFERGKTYNLPMRSTVKLYKDLDRLRKALAYYLNTKESIIELKYITAVEPQGVDAGYAWHGHIILLLPRAIYFNHTTIAKLWQHGFANIEKVGHADKLANYVASYLTNLNGKKGERLSLYPKGVRMCRYSRNLNKPIESVQLHSVTKEKLKALGYQEQEKKAQSVQLVAKKDGNIFTRQFDYENYTKI